jgi:hypothetical protein
MWSRIYPDSDLVLRRGEARTDDGYYGGAGLGWWRRPRAPKKGKRKQIRSVNFDVPDMRDWVRIGVYSVRPCNICRDASEVYIWAAFVSPRTTRSLCVGPLGQDAGAFFNHAVVNGRTFVSSRWRCPYKKGRSIYNRPKNEWMKNIDSILISIAFPI